MRHTPLPLTLDTEKVTNLLGMLPSEK